MKSFIFSLTLHMGFIFLTLHQNSSKPELSSSESVLHVSLRFHQDDLQVMQEKTQRLQKTARPKKIVPALNPEISHQRLEQKEVQKIEGKEQLHLYISELRQFIEAKKFYPKRALVMKQSGFVEICLDIDEFGNFSNIHIVNASNHATLNQAAMNLLLEISKFKPLPKDLGQKVTLNIPLRYEL